MNKEFLEYSSFKSKGKKINKEMLFQNLKNNEIEFRRSFETFNKKNSIKITFNSGDLDYMSNESRRHVSTHSVIGINFECTYH